MACKLCLPSTRLHPAFQSIIPPGIQLTPRVPTSRHLARSPPLLWPLPDPLDHA